MNNINSPTTEFYHKRRYPDAVRHISIPLLLKWFPGVERGIVIGHTQQLSENTRWMEFNTEEGLTLLPFDVKPADLRNVKLVHLVAQLREMDTRIRTQNSTITKLEKRLNTVEGIMRIGNDEASEPVPTIDDLDAVINAINAKIVIGETVTTKELQRRLHFKFSTHELSRAIKSCNGVKEVRKNNIRYNRFESPLTDK
jgi:hypothetical protein